MRTASRTDNTHREVIDALRAHGWLVKDTHRLPNFVDAVGWGRTKTQPTKRVYLIEIKTADAPYTEGQAAMLAEGWPILRLTSADDVRRLVGR